MSDEVNLGRLADEIKQANQAKALDEARAEYIRMLEKDDWKVTARALKEAVPILKSMGVEAPTECDVESKVLALLKKGHPLKAIGMDEPQGSNGIAHVMKGGYAAKLYIKIQFDGKTVRILSFHQ